MIHNNTPVNVALAAYGMSGTVFHAPVLDAHSGFNLKKILERSGTQRSRERYPDVTVVKDFDQILQDKDIDLVIVNTPEHTHFDLTKQALKAGKNVVVEKAFTPTSAEAQTLIDLARKSNCMLSVFQNSRFHGDFLTIKKIIENQLLGELVELEVHYDRFRNFIQQETWKEEPKPGTGTLYNLGSHIIDQVLQLFGRPDTVFADIRIQRPGGKIDDNFEVIMSYEGLKVTLKSSYLVKEPGPRYTLHGTNGSFLKPGGDTQEAFLKAGGSPLDEAFGTDPEDQWGLLNTEMNGVQFRGKVETLKGSYLEYYENIYNAIRKDEELFVKPEQAKETIEMIEAAMKSNQEKKVITTKK